MSTSHHNNQTKCDEDHRIYISKEQSSDLEHRVKERKEEKKHTDALSSSPPTASMPSCLARKALHALIVSSFSEEIPSDRLHSAEIELRTGREEVLSA